MWSVAAGANYPAADLETLWKSLLLNQFHDILPGSSIDWVYEEAERELERVTERATEIGDTAMSAIAGDGERLVAFNSTSHPRAEIVSLDGEYARIEAPSCGWAAVIPRSSEPEVSVTDHSMENELLRVEWDDHAVLTSIWDKAVGREVLRGPGNMFQLHDDNPRNWDAWDLDPEYRDSSIELTAVEKIQQRGGLRGLLTFGRSFGESWLFQLMSLDAGSRVLRFETFVEWRGGRKKVEGALSLAGRSPGGPPQIPLRPPPPPAPPGTRPGRAR